MSDCPVKTDFKHALSSAKEFTLAIRKLRRSLKTCDGCRVVDECGTHRQIGESVDQAITEITHEWLLNG